MSNENKLSKSELKEIVQKRKKKKIILVSCIALAAVILAVIAGIIVWSIVSVRPVKRNDTQAAVIGQVGEYDIYYDEFSYLVGIHKSNMEYKFGDINWDGDSALAKNCISQVEEKVREDIKKNYIVLELCKKYGVDTDGKEINKAVNEHIKTVIKTDFEGKKAKYAEWLEKNNLSDAYYRLIVKSGLLEEKLLEKLVSDGKEIKYSIKNFPEFSAFSKESDEFIRTIHVYYPKFDKYKVVDIQGVHDECVSISNALRTEADAQKRYDAMNDFIGACPYMVDGYTINTMDGVYFTEGMMGEEYEKVARSLDVYGVSDVLETDDGFYVIMRLPREDSYMDKHADTLLSNYQMAKLVLLERKTEKDIKFSCADFSKKVLDEIKK